MAYSYRTYAFDMITAVLTAESAKIAEKTQKQLRKLCVLGVLCGLFDTNCVSPIV